MKSSWIRRSVWIKLIKLYQFGPKLLFQRKKKLINQHKGSRKNTNLVVKAIPTFTYLNLNFLMQIFPMQIYIKNDQLFIKIKQISNTRVSTCDMNGFKLQSHFTHFLLSLLPTSLGDKFNTRWSFVNTLFLFLVSKSKPYLTITFTLSYFINLCNTLVLCCNEIL